MQLFLYIQELSPLWEK